MSATPPRPPRSDRDQVRWVRVVMLLGLIGSVAYVWSAMLHDPQIVVVHGTRPVAPAEAKVNAVASELKRAWHPNDRARILQGLRDAEDKAALEKALVASLAKARDANERRALLECARALDVKEVRCDIAGFKMAGATPGQSAAIDLAYQLKAWRSEEIEEMLRSQDRAVRVAVLDAIGRHGGSLADDVLVQKLTSEDVEESELALKTVPAKQSDELRDELLRLVAHGEPRAAAQALRALARSVQAAEHTELALSCLQTGRPEEVRRAALEFLLHLEAIVAHAGPIWSVVSDPLASEKLRLFALHCLELFGAAEAELLVSRSPVMDPAQRVLAARCLVRQGDDRCLDLLLGVLARDDVPEAIESARRMLAWLTGCAPTATAEQFQSVFAAAGRRVRTRYLPPHTLDVD